MTRRWGLSLAIALLGLLLLASTAAADSVDVIKNGSFEDEYTLGISKYWRVFNNGGDVSYGYHDDSWEPVVYDGDYSQLLEIHTKAVGGSQRDRYFGIQQTVDVVPNSRYMFSFFGMIRSTEGNESESQWNYRVELGFDYDGGDDPWSVTEWVEMPWPEHYRMDPGSFESYAKGITTTSDKLTVFIRVWKKFPTVYEEGNINIDAVSLIGPDPSAQLAAVVATPVVSEPEPVLPETGARMILPVLGVVLALTVLSLAGLRLARRRS